MYRLLIVDNEEYVVNGLCDMFNQQNHLNLDTTGVYSSLEALERIRSTKYDIVLSDIRMPGLNGIELHREIVRVWPRCKVIYLSGYDDFTYAQQALRNGSVNYILKTEGDEVIVRAVEQAIEQLKSEITSEQLLEKSRVQLKRAMTALQREFFSDILLSEYTGSHDLAGRMQELEVPLSSDAPVFLAVGRVDEWPGQPSLYEQSLLFYAIQNIASEYLEMSVNLYSFVFDRAKLVWLIQPKLPALAHNSKVAEDMWSITVRFVQGTFEYVQNTCKEVLKLPISVSCADESTPWPAIRAKFEQLKAALGQGLGLRSELIIYSSVDKDHLVNPFHQNPQPVQKRLPTHREMIDLDYWFEANDRGRALAAMSDWLQFSSEQVAEAGNKDSRVTVYYMLVSVLLANMERSRNTEALAGDVDLHRLTRLDLHKTWDEASSYLLEITEAIFRMKYKGMVQEEKELITEIYAYIDRHIRDDLSLTAIAGAVGYNPSYLSRLFKHQAGQGISEYISEVRLRRARELLEQNILRIHEIARDVGFLSENYFYRFFKKAMNMTPQEYRDSASRLSKG